MKPPRVDDTQKQKQEFTIFCYIYNSKRKPKMIFFKQHTQKLYKKSAICELLFQIHKILRFDSISCDLGLIIKYISFVPPPFLWRFFLAVSQATGDIYWRIFSNLFCRYLIYVIVHTHHLILMSQKCEHQLFTVIPKELLDR